MNLLNKALREIMSEGKMKQCNIELDVLKKHFKSVFENENSRTRKSYPSSPTANNVLVSKEDVEIKIKNISSLQDQIVYLCELYENSM